MAAAENIINLATEKEIRQPQLSGTALCINCRHEWIAVAPQGPEWLDCPQCQLMRGHYRFHCEPEGEAWACNCGNQLFYVMRNGICCPNCGALQTFPSGD
jgi:hypothetical protein